MWPERDGCFRAGRLLPGVLETKQRAIGHTEGKEGNGETQLSCGKYIRGAASSQRRGSRFALPLLLLLQLRDHAEIFERGRIAFDFAVGGEFAEQAAHDFAAASFGE